MCGDKVVLRVPSGMVSWSWIEIESPLWVLVRDFLTSADVLDMRTTRLKWNMARLCGSFAEVWFFF